VEVEVDLALPCLAAANTFDVDDVEVVEDRHVDREAGRVAEVAEVRRRNHAQLHRVDRREPEVEDARPEAVLLRRRVLLEVAERGERRDVAVRRRPAEPELASEVADPDERPAVAEGREDREPALERLRMTLGGHVPTIRTVS
jgi:hypothetical protein